MKISTALSIFILCSAGQALAESPTTAPAANQQVNLNPPAADAAGPTTAPTAEVSALIAQLGDSDFRARQRATDRLKEIGKAAIPALKDALRATDPEVQMRAQELIEAIERPPLPGTGSDSQHFRRSVRITIINGNKQIDASEGDRTVHIDDNSEGIHMKVTGSVDGKPATREYKAANADELKKNDPEAYALYEQYSGAQGGLIIQGINIRRGQIRINPAPVTQP